MLYFVRNKNSAPNKLIKTYLFESNMMPKYKVFEIKYKFLFASKISVLIIFC